MSSILITGANRGIGLALAQAANAGGHTVIGTARDPDRAAELAAVSEVLPLDVADAGSIADLAHRLEGRPIDILVNNAGVYPDKSGLAETDLEAFDLTCRVNIRGPLAVTRALLPNLESGRRRIVAHISSSMGSIAGTANGGSYAYRASKAAVNMLAKAMAAELRTFTILAVDPGWVRTDMGGSDASLAPEESAAGILGVLETSRPERSGAFLRHDGEPVDW